MEIVVELLSMFNITAVCAVNGREAVERFETDPPGTYALILMDIQMPVMDGYRLPVLSAAWERPAGGRTGLGFPLSPLTANAFADDVYRAKQAGMDEHVTSRWKSAVCWKSCTGTWTFQPGTVQNKSRIKSLLKNGPSLV